MPGPPVFHPFLFALFPALFFLAGNLDHFLVREALLPAGVSLAASLVAWAVLRALMKDGHKAGIAVSLGVFFFFSYGHLCNLVSGGRAHSFNNQGLQLLWVEWIVLFILAVFLLWRVRRSLAIVTTLLNTISICLITICLSGMVLDMWKERSAALDIASRQAAARRAVEPAQGETKRLPDIYYIVLDSYGSAETLKEEFDFDNREFTEFLGRRGFFSPERSRSGYAYTTASLASVTNMDYINYYVEHDYKALNRLIVESLARSTLEAHGYIYREIFPNREFALDNPRFLDVNIDFTTALLETSLARIAMTGTTAKASLYDTFRQRFLSAFESLEKVPQEDRPAFTFAHLLAVHPPYLFGADGGTLPISTAEIVQYSWEPRRRYLDQLVFVNGRLRRLVDIILAKSRVPPVIILHGDHGPDFGGNWEDPSRRFLRQRMRVFTSYLVPARCRPSLDNDFAPVNAFRIVFNDLFHEKWPLLQGRSYYSIPNKRSPVIDVTDIVR